MFDSKQGGVILLYLSLASTDKGIGVEAAHEYPKKACANRHIPVGWFVSSSHSFSPISQLTSCRSLAASIARIAMYQEVTKRGFSLAATGAVYRKS